MIDAEDILERIDFAPIVEAIRAEPITHWSYEDAAKIVWNVASRHLPRDLESYDKVAGIEEHWALLFGLDGPKVSFGEAADEQLRAFEPHGQIHGYTDLVMWRGESLELIDWKTASELDKSWSDKLSDSWQWRIYCAVYGAAGFIYRGIEKSGLAPRVPGQAYDWGKAPMKELRYVPDADNWARVEEFLCGTMLVRDRLASAYPEGRWPMHMPDACRPFNTRCSFWAECRDEAPRTQGAFVTKAFSYSGVSKFLACQELYRLATVTGRRDPSTATELGNAVHRGTAALYGQFNELKRHFYGEQDDTAAIPKSGSEAGRQGPGEQGHRDAASADAADGVSVPESDL